MVDSVYPPLPVDSYLYDAEGNAISSVAGSLDMHDAHVHHVPINELFHYHTGTTTTLSSPVIKNTKTISVVDGSSFPNLSSIHIKNGASETTFPIIISGGGTNTLVLDRPLDYSFDTGADIEIVDSNIAVNGSTTPVAFKLMAMAAAAQIWHIQTFILVMVHGAAADDTKFGGLGALTTIMVY